MTHSVDSKLVMTHYDILGISPDASAEEIRKAYRSRIFDFHPDRNAAREDHEFVFKINEAYRVLSDPALRLHYDFTLGNTGKPTPVLESWWVRVVAAFGEFSGVMLLLFLSPLAAFPVSAAAVLLALVFIGLFTALSLEPLFPPSENQDATPAETRTIIVATYLLLGWFLLNPFEATKEGDVLFSLALASILGGALAMATSKMADTIKRQTSLMIFSFLSGTAGATILFIELSGSIEEGGGIIIPGAPASDLFVALLPIAVGCVVLFQRKGRSRADANEITIAERK